MQKVPNKTHNKFKKNKTHKRLETAKHMKASKEQNTKGLEQIARKVQKRQKHIKG